MSQFTKVMQACYDLSLVDNPKLRNTEKFKEKRLKFATVLGEYLDIQVQKIVEAKLKVKDEDREPI